MTRLAALGAALIALPALARRPRTLLGLGDGFSTAFNSFVQQWAALSDSSPDYRSRIREIWMREEVGQKFRKFETRLMEGK